MTLYFLGMTSVWVLIPIYMQQGIGFTAFESGLIGIPICVCYPLRLRIGPVSASPSMGRKVVIAGLCMAMLGLTFSIAVILLHYYRRDQYLVAIANAWSFWFGSGLHH